MECSSRFKSTDFSLNFFANFSTFTAYRKFGIDIGFEFAVSGAESESELKRFLCFA